jgi:hypothetical protein
MFINILAIIINLFFHIYYSKEILSSDYELSDIQFMLVACLKHKHKMICLKISAKLPA